MKARLRKIWKYFKETVLPLRRWIRNVLLNLAKGNNYIAPTASVGENVELGGWCRLYPYVMIGNVKIGRYSYLAEYSRVSNAVIGPFTSIGPFSMIGLGIHAKSESFTTHPAFFSMQKQCGASFSTRCKIDERIKIDIGADVWIGARVTVLDGVKILTGAVIGAGSVVTKNVPAYEIWAGVPAKKISDRFGDVKTKQLIMESAWWNFDETLLEQLGACEALTGEELYKLLRSTRVK